MQEYLNYLFVKETISKLDKKYLEQIEGYEDYLFLSSNLKEFSKYHNFFLRGGNYNLNKKYDTKIIDVINLLLTDIKQNNYDKNLVLLLYSYVATYYLEKFLNKENHTKLYYKKLNLIDSYVANKYLNINPRHIVIEEKFNLKNEIMEDEFNKIIYDIYYFNASKYMLRQDIDYFITLNNRYQNDFLCIKRLYLLIKNLFHLKKEIPFTTLIKSKNKIYHKMLDDIEKEIDKAAKVLNLLALNIYYKKNNLKEITKLIEN